MAELAWKDHLQHLALLREAALDAADPYAAVLRHLRTDDDSMELGERRFALKQGNRVLIVGAGKAGASMARAVEAVLGDRLTDGIVSVPSLDVQAPSRVRLMQGGHPLPNRGSVSAARAIRRLLTGLRPEDLVLVLISGGGSALLELPVKGVRLEDIRRVTRMLLRRGAGILELNTVRPCLSQVKAGGLARMASPAFVVALVLSDVVGDPVEQIASGPTAMAPKRPHDALRILDRYGIRSDMVPRVFEHLRSDREAEDTIDHGRTPIHVVVGSNALAATAAAECARGLGFQTLLVTTSLEGEAREVGRVIAGLTKSVRSHGIPVSVPACLIFGGETTVTVRGQGRGGRNQELALAAAIALEGIRGVTLMAFATDGVDGPTPAAGAIVTGETAQMARALGLDPRAALAHNDSFTFFQAFGGALLLGATGTNVNDLVACLVYG